MKRDFYILYSLRRIQGETVSLADICHTDNLLTYINTRILAQSGIINIEPRQFDSFEDADVYLRLHDWRPLTKVTRTKNPSLSRLIIRRYICRTIEP